ncbi:MAG: hypothetical protein K0Q55_4083 [Verrucomicrobia bacterium]|nr:hypothetical protein [Verrucomicrobiota bacterium]
MTTARSLPEGSFVDLGETLWQPVRMAVPAVAKAVRARNCRRETGFRRSKFMIFPGMKFLQICLAKWGVAKLNCGPSVTWLDSSVGRAED